MRKLILTNFQSPGDVVMLTAAVRDLHDRYPNQFLTDVRTGSPELWENNPYLTPLDVRDPEVEVVECQYPLIESSTFRPVHFLEGFMEFLNERLQLKISPTRFKGDLHLSEEEKAMPSMVARTTGLDIPYWMIVAGGKFDYTIKWWHFRRWQAVVDQFRDRIQFVQVGAGHHYHPALDGVLDLRGQTPLRELVRLIHCAQGVLCPVTVHMHLSAAIEAREGEPANRPCVVVAGGRESPHWEAYPYHQFVHTVGMLPCCVHGGCWRSRSVPLGDGDEKDEPENLCQDVVNNLPHCMHLITPDQVAEKVELYIRGGGLRTLTPEESTELRPHRHRRAQRDLSVMRYANLHGQGEEVIQTTT